MKKYFTLIISMVLLLASCNMPSSATQIPDATDTLPIATDSWTETPASTFTFTPTETLTPTVTFTPTETLTPTITFTPTITATPTYAFPTVTVNKQAHCRYGPSVAYLHAAPVVGEDGRDTLTSHAAGEVAQALPWEIARLLRED